MERPSPYDATVGARIPGAGMAPAPTPTQETAHEQSRRPARRCPTRGAAQEADVSPPHPPGPDDRCRGGLPDPRMEAIVKTLHRLEAEERQRSLFRTEA